MPGKRRSRGSSDGRLDDALRALAAALGTTGVGWAVIGGIAVIAHGVRRLTTDIDAVMLGGELTISETLHVLASHAIDPRIDDAEAFAQHNLVLLLVHRPTGVEIDLSLRLDDESQSSPPWRNRPSYSKDSRR